MDGGMASRMRSVGFTGTQIGMSDNQKFHLRTILIGATEFHHGDCIGADEEADAIARDLGIRIVIHPPLDPKKRAFCYQPGDTIRRERPYLVRNRHIVHDTDELVAAPKDANNEELRSGTWSTIREARRTGKKVTILHR